MKTEVLQRNARQGILSSGSWKVPQGPETDLKAEVDIDSIDFVAAKELQFSLQVFDDTNKVWVEISSGTWVGPSQPGDPFPSVNTNATPHKDKRTRVVIDTLDRVNCGASIEIT